MSAFAPHLDDLAGLLAATRQCATLCDDLASALPGPGYPPTRRLVEDHARFVRKRAAAAHLGIREADDARRLLADAVDLALRLRDAYAVERGGDRILLDRAADVQAEFKPRHGRHYGLSIGDAVEMRAFGRSVAGTVEHLSSTDNNGGTIRLADGGVAKIVCEWCVRLDAFDGPEEAPAPAP